MRLTTLQKILSRTLAISEKNRVGILAKTCFFITGDLLTTHRNFYAADLSVTTNIGTTSSNILATFSDVYCHSVCWLLGVIELGVFLLAKHDKPVYIAKKCAIGTIVLYIALKAIGTDGGVVGDIVDRIIHWIMKSNKL